MHTYLSCNHGRELLAAQLCDKSCSLCLSPTPLTRAPSTILPYLARPQTASPTEMSAQPSPTTPRPPATARAPVLPPAPCARPFTRLSAAPVSSRICHCNCRRRRPAPSARVLLCAHTGHEAAPFGCEWLLHATTCAHVAPACPCPSVQTCRPVPSSRHPAARTALSLSPALPLSLQTASHTTTNARPVKRPSPARAAAPARMRLPRRRPSACRPLATARSAWTC